MLVKETKFKKGGGRAFSRISMLILRVKRYPEVKDCGIKMNLI